MVVQKTVANDVTESESLPESGSRVPLSNSDGEPPLSPVPAQMSVSLRLANRLLRCIVIVSAVSSRVPVATGATVSGPASVLASPRFRNL